MGAKPLYDTDIVAWADQQAEALRRLPSSQPRLSNVVDWANVIEEIEDVGNNKVSAVESMIRNILAHVIKMAADPEARPQNYRRREVANWHVQILADATRSMRAKIDMDRQWSLATKLAAAGLADHGVRLPAWMPQACPFPLDAILDPDMDAEALSRDLVARHRPTP